MWPTIILLQSKKGGAGKIASLRAYFGFFCPRMISQTPLGVSSHAAHTEEGGGSYRREKGGPLIRSSMI